MYNEKDKTSCIKGTHECVPTNEVCDYTAIAAASGGVVEEGLPVRREERVESWIKEEYISSVGD
jgi:activator of HSP90 ATPase